ncbi:(2Fe-2S)-binding protein [Limimonas halophila]|uniref:(2Fe-2S)-binding protein n=1 Tax=Limimonas halophila TaxID=1082479 RepID=UPI001C40B889|nr:hypothetical protein [Limimonas halophila]
MSEVYRQCGCQPQCGKCAGAIRDILREHQQPANAGGAFLEGAAAHPPSEG